WCIQINEPYHYVYLLVMAVYHSSRNKLTLGHVTEKQGSSQPIHKANNYYTSILEKYPEVGDYAELARTRLEKLRNKNTFIDTRDGHKYKWVKIGDQVWMAENLAYMPWVNPPKKQEYGIWVYDYEGNKVSEAIATENYQKYGCLYDWPTSMAIDPKYLEEPWEGDPENQQGLCPPGWRMPSDKDWMELESFLGMPDSVLELTWERAGESIGLPPIGRYLRSTHTWLSGRSGNNASGFNALPAGSIIISSRSREEFNSIGYHAGFWSSTSSNIKPPYGDDLVTAWYRSLWPQPTNKWGDQDEVNRDTDGRRKGNSIRCLKKDIDIGQDQHAVDFLKERKQNTPRFHKISLSKNLSIGPIWNTQTESKYVLRTKVIDGRVIYHKRGETVFCRNIRNGDICWETKVNGTISALEIHNNLIYISTGIGGRGASATSTTAYAIDPNSGQIIWEWETGLRFRQFEFLPLENDLLISSGELICFNPKDKLEEWRFDPNKNVDKSVNPTRFGGTRGVLTYKDLIVIGLFQSSRSVANTEVPVMIAFDKNTQEIKWEFSGQGLIQQKPVLQDEMVIYTDWDEYVYSLDVYDGKKIWRTYVGKEFGDQILCVNSIAIVIGANKRLIGINIQTGNILWESSEISMYGRSPIRFHNKVLAFDRDNQNVVLLDPKTGELIWGFKVPSKPWSISTDQESVVVSTKDGIYCYDVSVLNE
ncbi:MAG: PQQ-binding-like beta-propeller repeat protein, partial [Bacteroidetes bacterium]|nr:PQQ-binding-like beta-propeller repeat protein [Bacteroidota bacterium]